MQIAYAGPVKNILALQLYEMTSFTSKSEQNKENHKDECSHRSGKEGRSCTLAKDEIRGSIFLNAAVK
jgi:hypothetical protein